MRILDIGCGAGNGVAALIRQFPSSRIISTDENAECIELARHRLESIGANVNVVKRLKDKPTGPRSHQLGFEHGKLVAREGIDLIESDMLSHQYKRCS